MSEPKKDLSALSPMLVGWEGWRVECVTKHGTRERFIVGRSTGWRPAHLALKRRNSQSGWLAPSDLTHMVPLENIRGKLPADACAANHAWHERLARQWADVQG